MEHQVWFLGRKVTGSSHEEDAAALFRLNSTLKIDFSVMCLFLLVAITVRVKFVQISHFRNIGLVAIFKKRCSARVPLVVRVQIKKQSCGNDGYESLPG